MFSLGEIDVAPELLQYHRIDIGNQLTAVIRTPSQSKITSSNTVFGTVLEDSMWQESFLLQCDIVFE
jgi:hypothetical protein